MLAQKLARSNLNLKEKKLRTSAVGSETHIKLTTPCHARNSVAPTIVLKSFWQELITAHVYSKQRTVIGGRALEISWAGEKGYATRQTAKSVNRQQQLMLTP
jgi:hypothetical protein